MKVIAKYQVRVKNQTGEIIAIFDNWQHLAIYKRVNVVGSFVFTIDATDARAQLFDLDGQFEVWRRLIMESGHISIDTDWYLEYEGLIRDRSYGFGQYGNQSLTISGLSYLDFVARRYIMYSPGHANSSQSDVGETVIKNFVKQNLGSDATVLNGRLRDGVMPELIVETDNGNGDYWEGQRSYKKLINVISEVASISGIDYDVIGAGVNSYIFRVYNEQRGSNRTTQGLVKQTGKNSYGLSPVIFSVDFGNMGNPKYEWNRSSEANVVFTLGQGVDEEREIDVETNDESIGDSPFNTIETTRDARRQSEASSLQYLGEEKLIEKRGTERFTFSALQIPRSLYGYHYFFGDMVTAQFYDRIVDKKIVAVDIIVDKDVENINITLDDYIRI